MQLLIAGAGVGVLYGLLALGIVVVYKTTRIINFATGGVAMITGFVAWSLVHDLDVTYPLALVLSLEFAALLGLLIARGPMHLLQGRSRLSAVVMTVAIGMLLQATVLLIWGGRQSFYRLEPIFLRRQISVLGIRMSSETLAIIVSAGLLALLLWALFSFLPQGLALRALAENPDHAELVGIDTRAMSSLAWVLGGLTAGAAGLLISPTIVMDAYQVPFLMAKALAAALLGRLTSFGWAMAGGIGVGILEVEFGTRVARPGAAELAILVLVVGSLAVRLRAEPIGLQEDLAR